MKNFIIIQWIGDYKYYVKRMYCKRVIVSQYFSNAKRFDEMGAKRYLLKLRAISNCEFERKQIDVPKLL